MEHLDINRNLELFLQLRMGSHNCLFRDYAPLVTMHFTSLLQCVEYIAPVARHFSCHLTKLQSDEAYEKTGISG